MAADALSSVDEMVCAGERWMWKADVDVVVVCVSASSEMKEPCCVLEVVARGRNDAASPVPIHLHVNVYSWEQAADKLPLCND